MTEGDISFTAKRLMGNKEKWFPRKIKVGFPEKNGTGYVHKNNQCPLSGEVLLLLWGMELLMCVLCLIRAPGISCWMLSGPTRKFISYI